MTKMSTTEIAATRARFLRASPKSTPDLQEKIALNEESNMHFVELVDYLIDTVPAGRDLNTALTHLQTAKFFINEARINEHRGTVRILPSEASK